MKLIYGVGVNDSDYVIRPGARGKSVVCHAYVAWVHMLERCYSNRYHEINPTYIGVSVCNEWKSFMSFRSWWVKNHVNGWHLDKDLLTDGGVYSPYACTYVPQWLNKFTTDRLAARGAFPVGVYYNKNTGKYIAQCSHPFGRREYLGRFTTADEAHASWLARKLEIANELRHLMDDIDARIFPRVIEIISRAK